MFGAAILCLRANWDGSRNNFLGRGGAVAKIYEHPQGNGETLAEIFWVGQREREPKRNFSLFEQMIMFRFVVVVIALSKTKQINFGYDFFFEKSFFILLENTASV